ncbi:MAG: hypothetical protein LBB22_02015, partial [Treponema sp.]|nr:hypothetical protein [Treponema sp.]
TTLEKIKSDPGLAHAYDMYEQTIMDYKFGIQGARQEGRQEGRQARRPDRNCPESQERRRACPTDSSMDRPFAR